MRKLLCVLLAVLLAMGCLPGMAEVKADERIDIDLSILSESDAYEQLVGILLHSQAYLGMIVRVRGHLDLFYDEARDILYTSCMLSGGAGNDPEVLEFVWEDAPEDWNAYLSYGMELVVTGRFETYTEDGVLYAHLVSARVEWIEEEFFLA